MFSSARCEAGDERPSLSAIGEWFYSHATADASDMRHTVSREQHLQLR